MLTVILPLFISVDIMDLAEWGIFDQNREIEKLAEFLGGRKNN